MVVARGSCLCCPWVNQALYLAINLKEINMSINIMNNRAYTVITLFTNLCTIWSILQLRCNWTILWFLGNVKHCTTTCQQYGYRQGDLDSSLDLPNLRNFHRIASIRRQYWVALRHKLDGDIINVIFKMVLWVLLNLSDCWRLKDFSLTSVQWGSSLHG